MKYYCESGKHLLFDDKNIPPCSGCADLARLIQAQVVLPKQLHLCATHKTNAQEKCLSCRIALDWNVGRRYCIACGDPATGYRAMSADKPVEFYCDTHWVDVPASARKQTEISGQGPIPSGASSGDAV